MHEVRKATPADVPALAAALGRAFHDDPVFGWLFPSPEDRRRWAWRFFAVRMRQFLGQEEVYASGDVGAAVWAMPERWDLGWRGVLDLVPLLRGLGWRVPRSLLGTVRVDRAHPATPHWYLAVLGVDPPAQGQGIGSALLAPVLAECDRDGVGAYLETATERDIVFYSRFGFRVTDELRLPQGPPIWLMWRDPR
jgi:GNAT superfamily N-acetyltransferase